MRLWRFFLDLKRTFDHEKDFLPVTAVILSAILLSALERAEAYYQQEGLNLSHPPVAFVIFGPPVSIFFKENYQKNQKVVDLAAKLMALKVIDVKVCQFSYIKAGLDGENLLPFVSTVPFGPDELTRLIEDEDYSYF